jgi:hypothetical protein
MPPVRRDLRRTPPASRATKKEEVELPKSILTPSAGWTAENYCFLKSAPESRLAENIFKILGVPLAYKDSPDHPAVDVLIEFHISSFFFAQQLPDTNKALMALMLLTDYIGNVPAFGNSRDSFSHWLERTTRIVQASDFTPAEQQLMLSYVNTNLRANAPVLHYVISHEAMQELDAEGLQLFKPVIPVRKESALEETPEAGDVPEAEVDIEAQLSAAVAAERWAAEEARKKKEVQTALEAMLAESAARLKQAVDGRCEPIFQKIVMVEERLYGKKRIPPK